MTGINERLIVTVLDMEYLYYYVENGINGSFWGPTLALLKFSVNMLIRLS